MPMKRSNDMKKGDVYGFDKKQYLSDLEIDQLYQRKIDLSKMQGGKDKLFKASLYDPRHSDIYFGTDLSAKRAKVIADKLDALGSSEFLISSFPSEWMDDFAGESIFKIVNNNILKPSANSKSQSIFPKVIDIVFSSTRSIPAHYNSSGDRTKSFGVSFDIEKESEYNLASEAFYKIPSYLDKEKQKLIPKPEWEMVLKIGEDVILGSYVATKLDCKGMLDELMKEVTIRNIDHWGKEDKTKTLEQQVLPSETVQRYFYDCAKYGYKLALKRIAR